MINICRNLMKRRMEVSGVEATSLCENYANTRWSLGLRKSQEGQLRVVKPLRNWHILLSSVPYRNQHLNLTDFSSTKSRSFVKERIHQQKNEFID